jgi:hypothetical protein
MPCFTSKHAQAQQQETCATPFSNEISDKMKRLPSLSKCLENMILPAKAKQIQRVFSKPSQHNLNDEITQMVNRETAISPMNAAKLGRRRSCDKHRQRGKPLRQVATC